MKNKLFLWKGINKKGDYQQGELYSSSIIFAKLMLLQQGIQTIFQLKEKKFSFTFFKSNTIKSDLLMIFFQQLALLLQSGIDLLSCLSTLENIEDSQKHTSIKNVIIIVKDDIKKGLLLSQSLKKFKQVSSLELALIETGEQTGRLSEMLQQITRYRQQNNKLKQQLFSIVFYPCTVLLIAALVTLVLLLFVIPQFATLFQEQNISLPFLTQVIVDLSKELKNSGITLISYSFIFLLSLFTIKRYSKKVRFLCDKLILKLFFIGSLIEKNILTRCLNSLLTLLDAGIPLLSCFPYVLNNTRNTYYQKAFKQVQLSIQQGKNFHAALAQTQVFPNLLIQLSASGEISGQLTIMLRQAVLLYEQDLQRQLNQLQQRLEPIIMMILAVIIATLMLAMYLPLFQLGMAF